jgi:phage-related tail protein
MARTPTPKTKAEVKAAKAGLKEALKKSAETLAPFKSSAVAADKAVNAAKKAYIQAELAATKARAKLEKAMVAYAKGAEKIQAKLDALTGADA